MNVELSNVRNGWFTFGKWFNELKKTLGPILSLCKRSFFGGFPIPSISPNTKKTGITNPTLRNFGRPTVRGYQTYSPRMTSKIYTMVSKSCQQQVSAGIYFLSWHLCLLIQRIFFLIKRPLISLTYLGPVLGTNLSSSTWTLCLFLPVGDIFRVGEDVFFLFFHLSVPPHPFTNPSYPPTKVEDQPLLDHRQWD